MENAKLYGTDMCKKQKGVVGQLGSPATVAYLRNDYWVSNNMKIEWKEGCNAPGTAPWKSSAPAPGLNAWMSCG